MLRIKDPKRSLEFYTGVLGMRLSATLNFEAQRFSLYFLEFGESALPADEGNRLEDVFSRPGFLELTHNHGTELEKGEPYHNGNKDPKGFGHIAISIPDLEAAVTSVHAAATAASMDLRRVHGQQMQAFTAAALPLGIPVVTS